MKKVPKHNDEDLHVTKRYFTIKEAAEELEEGPHIIRTWLKTFDGFSPKKGWPRKLNESDIQRLKTIKVLLRSKLYKVDGAKQELKTELKKRGDKQLETAA
jgi:transposase